jgi:hypothetical protein
VYQTLLELEVLCTNRIKEMVTYEYQKYILKIEPMKIRIIIWLLALLVLAACNIRTKKNQQSNEARFKDGIKVASLSLEFEYKGKAIQKENTHVWGSSPIMGKDGKLHLYVAEWPIPEDIKKERFSGWFKHSRIAHYVGDSPEGPFEFVRIAVADKDGKFNAPHNPTVSYHDGKYVLCFIVNEDDDTSKQRIVMYVADDLSDNWRAAKGSDVDGTILAAPADSSIWNYNPRLGVSNPTLIKFKRKYMMYYKSVIPDQNDRDNREKWDYGYGVALADNVEGPYTCHPKRVTDEGLQLEDAYAFSYNNKVYMLSRDFRGSLGSQGGGLLWQSDDGFYFSKEKVKRSYRELAYYLGEEDLNGAVAYRGKTEGHMERAQLLFKDGKPFYMYAATGVNNVDGFGSCSHVFKLYIE